MANIALPLHAVSLLPSFRWLLVFAHQPYGHFATVMLCKPA
ncbi:hypothetical protein [Paenibacillus assamensis]|nr:hypothetical protein [Paenibacillus assamensis]